MLTEKCKILHNFFGLNWHLNSYFEVLASNVVVFGDGGLWEIIKFRLGHAHGDLMIGLEPLGEAPPKKLPILTHPFSLSFSTPAMKGDSKKATIHRQEERSHWKTTVLAP